MIINCSAATIKLGRSMAALYNRTFVNLHFKHFSNHELWLQLNQSLSGNVYLLQDMQEAPQERLFELMLAADTIKKYYPEAQINAIIPYLAYSRQDRAFAATSSVAADLVLKLLCASAIDKVICIDLHSNRLLLNSPVQLHNLNPAPIFASYLMQNYNLEDFIILAPDQGARARANNLAALLNIPYEVANKTRSNSGIFHSIPHISLGKNYVIVDDIIDSGSTIISISEILHNNGAKQILVCASCGIFSANAYEKIEASPIDKILTLEIRDKSYGSNKIVALNALDIFKEIL